MHNNERINTEKDSIWLENKNIVRIKLNNGFEFTEADVQRHFETYAKLGIGINNKVLLLADTTADFSMTKEARDFSANKAKEYFTAGAIVSTSLTTRMLVNFLNSFYNFGFPLKLFAQEKEALVWLEELISKQINNRY